jgi:3-(3-hydroxy-phenyl)propionate hydroxylase
MTGIMLPQPEISTTDGNKTLLDNALGPGFALLCLHDDPQRAFASLKAGIWRRLDVRFVAISYRDTIHRVHDFPLKRQKLFVLVRPDRYILGVFQEQQAEMFAARLQNYLAAFPRSSFSHNANHYDTNPDDTEK